MKRDIIIFLAVCSLAAAMIPRDRRALNTEEEEEMVQSQTTEISSTTSNTRKICEQQTPCAWSLYKTKSKYIEMNITNTYCICSNDMLCLIHEEDTTISAFVYRCKSPPKSEEKADDR